MDVVTPNARLARSGQFCCGDEPVASAAEVRVRVDEARHDRLARGVDRLRAGGDRDAARGPTATMRLPSTTSAVLDHLVARGHRHDAPAAERDRRRSARRSAREADVHARRPAARLSGAPSRKANCVARSRVKSSGPSAQCTRRLSPDQCS